MRQQLVVTAALVVTMVVTAALVVTVVMTAATLVVTAAIVAAIIVAAAAVTATIKRVATLVVVTAEVLAAVVAATDSIGSRSIGSGQAEHGAEQGRCLCRHQDLRSRCRRSLGHLQSRGD